MCTRLKLKETEYFFEELKRNVEDDRIFSFSLSGFVTSARSVTFLMQKEFQDIARFEDEYTKKQRLRRSDQNFKFFNELRVASVHTKALLPNKKVKEVIIKPKIPITDSVSVRVIPAGKVYEEYSGKDGNQDTRSISLSSRKALKPLRLSSKKSSK